MIRFISIIVPVYNEAGNISELILKIYEVMETTDYSYEIIIINDGSSDETWNLINELAKKLSPIKGIDLAGNYGQTVALRAGFELAQGDVIIAMDGDLQHDPQDIPRFIEYMEKGYDMVGGVKQKRPEQGLRKFITNVAHYIIYKISGVKLRYFGATFKAYRSYLLKNANIIGDATRFLGAIIARKGVRIIEIPIIIRERKAGRSSYKFTTVVLEVIIDLIFLKFFLSYMRKPFRLFGILGLFSLFIGSIVITSLLIGYFFFNIHIKQDYLAELLFSMFLIISGIMLISFGVIAEIGIYNYFVKRNENLYNIRSQTNNIVKS